MSELLTIAEGLAGLNPTPNATKKQCKEQGAQVLRNQLEEGEVDPYEVMSQLAKVRELIAGYEAELRAQDHPDYICTGHTINGVEYKQKGGAKKYNFTEDPKCLALEMKIKERKELLKTAAMIEDDVMDSDGEKVPQVSITYGKDSLTIKF